MNTRFHNYNMIPLLYHGIAKVICLERDSTVSSPFPSRCLPLLSDWNALLFLSSISSVKLEFPSPRPYFIRNVMKLIYEVCARHTLSFLLLDLCPLQVQWSSCNIFSTQDHSAAAIAKTGVPGNMCWCASLSSVCSKAAQSSVDKENSEFRDASSLKRVLHAG